MADIIDTCGLSCPQPVLLVLECLKKDVAALEVLVDNDASQENVTRAASNRGYAVNIVPGHKAGVTRLHLAKG